jgi:hypothetical protein
MYIQNSDGWEPKFLDPILIQTNVNSKMPTFKLIKTDDVTTLLCERIGCVSSPRREYIQIQRGDIPRHVAAL